MKTTYCYRTFTPPTLYFHLTHPENLERIEREGLQADAEGDIFAFTNLIVADVIAGEQVFVDPYVLFWIHPRGITGKVYADDVAEFSSRFQCIIKQKHIEPQYVHYLGTMRIQTDTLTPWRRLLDASLGLSRQQSEDVFRQIRDAMNRGRA